MITLSYGDLVCLIFIIALLWAAGVFGLLHMLEKWGVLKR